MDTSYYNDAVCEYFCPLAGSGTPDQCFLGDSLCDYDYEAKSKYSGQETVRGQLVNMYDYHENIVIVKVSLDNSLATCFPGLGLNISETGTDDEYYYYEYN